MLCMSCNRRGRWYKSSFKPSVSHMLFGQFLSQNMTEVISFFTMKVMCGCVRDLFSPWDWLWSTKPLFHNFSINSSLTVQWISKFHTQTEWKEVIPVFAKQEISAVLVMTFFSMFFHFIDCAWESAACQWLSELSAVNVALQPYTLCIYIKKAVTEKGKKLPYWSSASCEVLKSSQRCFLGIVSGTLCY